LIANNIQAVITNLEEPVWTQEEIQKQISEPQTNLFSNKGNFNLKRNPHQKPTITHIPPTPPKDNNNSRDKDLTVLETDNLHSLADENLLREVTNLIKIYQNKEKKFGGELYNTLRTKLQVFQDCCNKVGIMRHQYYYTFSVMLKGRATTFYYDYIAGKRHDFDTML
jgi:hypothetical protein